MTPRKLKVEWTFEPAPLNMRVHEEAFLQVVEEMQAEVEREITRRLMVPMSVFVGKPIDKPIDKIDWLREGF